MSAVSYAIQLTAPGVACDGTTQPAGTIINFVLWDGKSDYAPHDYAGNTTNVMLVPATEGMVFYAPASPAPTSCSPVDFINRLTQAEQTAITAAGQSNTLVQLWLFKLASASSVTTTDSLTVAGVEQMVSAGLLTQARATQILDLSRASP